jgi:phage terminase small subunit
MALTPKQQAFVQEYLIDLNATQAAIRAGYSARTANEQASRLLANVKVAAAVAKAVEKRAERTQVDQDYVLNTIVDTVERCRQIKPVLDRKGEQVWVETPEGEIAPAYTFDASAVLKGSELLGKHLKLFTDKVETTGKDGGPIENKWVVEIIGMDKGK